LRRGDHVQCELDANSILQVVRINSLVPGFLIGLTHPTSAELLVKRALEALLGAGFEVHRPGDGYAEVFIHAPLGTDIESVDLPTVPGSWRPVVFMNTEQRRAQIEAEVDFRLDATPVINTDPIDYWAADDEAWSLLGADDPALLGAIQTIAAADPRVLATIEAGRHQDVLTYLDRLMVFDPRTLPPLDRPLLVDPTAV